MEPASSLPASEMSEPEGEELMHGCDSGHEDGGGAGHHHESKRDRTCGGSASDDDQWGSPSGSAARRYTGHAGVIPVAPDKGDRWTEMGGGHPPASECFGTLGPLGVLHGMGAPCGAGGAGKEGACVEFSMSQGLSRLVG